MLQLLLLLPLLVLQLLLSVLFIKMIKNIIIVIVMIILRSSSILKMYPSYFENRITSPKLDQITLFCTVSLQNIIKYAIVISQYSVLYSIKLSVFSNWQLSPLSVELSDQLQDTYPISQKCHKRAFLE